MCPRTKEQLEIIREEKSQLIAEAATGLFASHGFDATSISEIAKKAGVSKGLIYNYFDSKEDILKNIVGHVFTDIWAELGFSGINKLNKEHYIRFINQSLDLVLKDLDHWRLYFAIFTQPRVMSVVFEDLMADSAPYLKLLRDYYVEEGYEDPDTQMRYVAALLDGMQMHIMLDPENFPLEKIRAKLIKELTEKP